MKNCLLINFRVHFCKENKKRIKILFDHKNRIKIHPEVSITMMRMRFPLFKLENKNCLYLFVHYLVILFS